MPPRRHTFRTSVAGLLSSLGVLVIVLPACLLLATSVGSLQVQCFAGSPVDTPVLETLHADGDAEQTSSPAEFPQDIRLFFNRYCIDCHGSQRQRAELRLDTFESVTATTAHLAKTFERLLDMLEAGDMPPEGSLQPAADECDRITDWLKSQLDSVDRAASKPPRRVTVRRLNRAEYDNTIRDLVGVDFNPAADFPSDDVGYGFDNMGDVLSVSPLLMEKYLDAAEEILQRAILAEAHLPPSRERCEADGLQWRGRVRPDEYRGLKLTQGLGFTNFDVPVSGEYILRAQACADQEEGHPLTMGLRLDGEKIADFAVDAPPDAPKVYEIRVPVSAGNRELAVTFANEQGDDESPEKSRTDEHRRHLYVQYLEIHGPVAIAATAIPATHPRLIPCRPDAVHSVEEAARLVLEPFVRRAYRRPVNHDDLHGLVRLVKAAVKHGETFERGIQIAMEAVLVSPHFLFRLEWNVPPQDDPDALRLREYQLASRLSYFLWSSMPDDELLTCADAGTLSSDAVLANQIERMLKDPRSESLADNFAEQWLQLRKLDDSHPDPSQFPSFDEQLRKDMRQESRLFFMAVLREGSLFDFIDGRYTFLNERLASHYGIPDIVGDEFQRVSLTEYPRAGILTQASVLTVTSNPSHTSPVSRGKWVLESILGTPPPPPPPDIPDLSVARESAPGASLRQQLEIHRSKADCAVCHREMDPLGFGFENFDAIGRWRDHDGSAPVDATGTLPSGETFSGPVELAATLRRRDNEFRRTLVEKLLTYALGRGLESADRDQIERITKTVADRGDRFATLIVEVAQSVPFRMQLQETIP